MAVSYPLDFLDDFPGWSTSFELLYRQEQSRQANGRTIVKDFGSPLWTATYQSRTLKPGALDTWKARLATLENGLQTFKARPTSRCYPIAYPNGSWPTGGSFLGTEATIASVGVNNKSITVDLLPAAYELSVGDFISIGPGDLHQVVEAGTADGGGVSSLFEVRPHLWPGTAVNDIVHVKKPHCIMSIVPGSVSTSSDLVGWGSVSFQAIEVR